MYEHEPQPDRRLTEAQEATLGGLCTTFEVEYDTDRDWLTGYTEDDRCASCGAHISEPHAPQCLIGDIEPDDEADAAEWRAADE